MDPMLASIPGEVIQLRPGLPADSTGGRDLGKRQQVSAWPRAGPQSTQHSGHWRATRNPQVTSAAPPSMSGFRVKILLASIQKDLLRQGASVLVIGPDDASDTGSASFPGIEVRGLDRDPLVAVPPPAAILTQLRRRLNREVRHGYHLQKEASPRMPLSQTFLRRAPRR